MLKKYISKFTIDILPSVLATIIGAYIVNHYIVTKPDAPAAAVASTPQKPGTASEVAGIPEPGVKAKGVSEKALLEKTASERPASAERPAETASLPVEPHRVQPAPREKPAVKTSQTSPSAAPVEAATAPEEKRDATDLARAAIERLRSIPEAQPRAQEAAESPRISEAPKVTALPAAQPLPPPIMVSTPGNDAFNPATGSLAARPASSSAQIDDQRPTPPADIPSSARPLDLRAELAEVPTRQRSSVAEDVLSAAKSVFHAVLPH